VCSASTNRRSPSGPLGPGGPEKLDRAPGAGDTIDGVRTEQECQLLATGEFSRRTGLSLKALRIYDENGLLKPATVDPDSGRRGYAPGQIRAARLMTRRSP
jgi:MerR family regulatory protein